MRRTPWLVLALLAACDASEPVSSGASAAFRVPAGQFVAASFPVAAPDPDAGAAPPPPDAGDDDAIAPPPRVLDVSSVNNSVTPGTRGRALTGRVSFNTRTVAVGLEGDVGYWLVPVGAPDIENPPDLDFAASVDYALALAPGPHRVLFAAADALGAFGPSRALNIVALPILPDAELVVSLDWSVDMDLDLVVDQPDGSVLTARGVRAPDGTYATTTDPSVNIDSNGGCAIDGQRRETATWQAPPSGLYAVRVREWSPCGQASTGWRVTIARHGTVLGQYVGASYASEADAPGGGPDGTGRLVVQFTVD